MLSASTGKNSLLGANLYIIYLYLLICTYLQYIHFDKYVQEGAKQNFQVNTNLRRFDCGLPDAKEIPDQWDIPRHARKQRHETPRRSHGKDESGPDG